MEKILSGCYPLHRNQRTTRELVSRCRKWSMTASAEGWVKTKALCSERRQWWRPQHCTKSRARRPSWRVFFDAWRRFFISIFCLPMLCLFDAWRRWPPRTFSSRFFWFLSFVFPCSVFSPCVCHNWSRLQWMFLDGLIAFYIDKKQYSKRFSKS